MTTKYPVREDMVLVVLDTKYVYIPKIVFEMLFENSHIYYRQDYKKALDDNKIRFNKLRELSREAGIPYSLFFAPPEKVEEAIKRNNEIIFDGVQDVPVAISSRGDVRVRDVNLIIKDIQKRQQFMAKNHRETEANPINNIRQEQEISEAAKTIIDALELDMDKFRKYKSKESAYNYLVTCLEQKNILVSRSRIGVMPQTIKRGLNFSGFSVRHKKYPAIFLHSRDEDHISDPAGRRIFTVFLLLACMANKRFTTVSYNQNVREPAQNIEYMVAEETLMPREMIYGISIKDMEELDSLAKAFKVTPSMALVRLKRIECIDEDLFEELFKSIENKWRIDSKKESGKGYIFNAKDTTRVITYNGKLYTSEVMSLLKTGKIGINDASRLLLFKKKSKTLLNEIGNQL